MGRNRFRAAGQSCRLTVLALLAVWASLVSVYASPTIYTGTSPVMTKAVTDPVNNCPGSQPTSTTSFAQTDPRVVVWFALDGLSTGDNVLVRFYDNNGTVQPGLDYPYVQIPSPGGAFAFCAAFQPNASTGVGTRDMRAFVNGQGPL